MKSLTGISVCIYVLATVFCANGATKRQTEGIYLCYKVSTAPIIDGKLDETEWQQADLVNFVVRNTGLAPQKQTQCRALWDETNLYLAFETVDDNIWSTMDNRDDRTHKEENIEFFIDPGADEVDYLEFQINCIETIADLLMSKPYSAGGSGNWNWNASSILAAVTVNGTVNDDSDVDVGMTVEIGLPWSDIATAGGQAFPPKISDSLSILFARVERSGGEVEYSCSKRTDFGNGGFHVPSQFGRLVFADNKTGIAPQSKVLKSSNVDIDRYIDGNNLQVSSNSVNIISLSVYNAQGKLVKSLKNNVDKNIRLDISNLSRGFYTSRIELFGGEIESFQFMK